MAERYSQICEVVKSQFCGYAEGQEIEKEVRKMKQSEYLEAVKTRLNLPSDYALAKRLGISPQSMTGWKNGTRNIPLDMAFKLAITLEIDPAQVVADLESQREKSPQRKEFWQGFISRAATVLLVLTCTLALNFSDIYGNAASMHGGKRRRLYCA